jgi:serine/threonine-protein kinase RIO1
MSLSYATITHTQVFKTTLNEFSNRADYVSGDSRYTGVKFNKAGRHRMFKLWAEKECRNLARAVRAHLPVPAPLIQRQHVVSSR